MNIEVADTGREVKPARTKQVLKLGADSIFRSFNVDKIIGETNDFIILQFNVCMLIGQ